MPATVAPGGASGMAGAPNLRGVSVFLVDTTAFKAAEALYPQSLVGSIPIHSRQTQFTARSFARPPRIWRSSISR